MVVVAEGERGEVAAALDLVSVKVSPPLLLVLSPVHRDQLRSSSSETPRGVMEMGSQKG